jgi:Flp pilus assembly pilin Flp
MLRTLKRLVHEEDGMEMVEWAVVGVVFALAAAAVWTTLKDDIGQALTKIGDCVGEGTGCPTADTGV